MSKTASKTEKPVDVVKEELALEQTTIAALRQELQEMKDAAAAPVTVKRETIETIRNDKNPLVIKPNPTWPAMFEIKRSEGGQVPYELSGQFTSILIAEKAIQQHLG